MLIFITVWLCIEFYNVSQSVLDLIWPLHIEVSFKGLSNWWVSFLYSWGIGWPLRNVYTQRIPGKLKVQRVLEPSIPDAFPENKQNESVKNYGSFGVG